MPHPFMEYPEAAGKTVEHIRYYDDPSAMPEVHVRFTDGTALSLKLCSTLKVEAELYRTHEGDVPDLATLPGSIVPIHLLSDFQYLADEALSR